MNILCIGAHPDDIELGCGGTMIKAAKEGHRIFMYVLTRGGASGDPLQRTRELIASAHYVGAEKLWADSFEDSKMTVTSKLINHIEYFIHKAAPDIILTHSLDDYHHDHRAIAEATMEASRFSQNVLAYEVPITKKFTPHAYYDISDVLEEKVELIKIFESQRNKLFTTTHAVKGLAEYRAFQNRMNGSIRAVEAFEILKMCFGSNFEITQLPQYPLPDSVAQEVNTAEIFEYAGKPVRRRIEPANGSGSNFTDLFQTVNK